MNNLQANYELILTELQKLTKTDNFYFKLIKPKLSDIEIVSLIVLAKYKSIGFEHQLFKGNIGLELVSK
ncbi:hypothetical protein BWK62_02120 [Flavobacterium oreochromis]|uniref:IS982 family transposase n=2 Tax=Flavobacterium TaxID=237 RepID=A0A2D0AI72_9FLAO|nr:hypothetical protein [Flavobacterium oreochromis]OWP74810.1 hypothetical protein BWG23_12910 [Flavobacterium oreochromis]OWP79510.1 hypothetical protein BWK62_02120 [Flavobacterium oreochromis]